MEENRIEAGMREWRGHVKRLTEIFGDSIAGSKDMAKAQLAQYREVIGKPLPSMTNDEKVMRSILRGEIRRMEKALYPYLIVRIARSVGRAFTKNPDSVSKVTSQARLIIQPTAVTKRNVAPVRTLDRSQKIKHNLIPKKAERHSKGIKR
jgi:hypothetical protein